MNTFFKKIIFAAGLLLLNFSFTSCDKNETQIEKEVVVLADNVINNNNETKIEVVSRKPIVFIAGFDKGNETFYSSSRSYFNEKGIKVIDGQYSLEEIILWLNKNANQKIYGDIHIVNKSNPYKGMNLETIVRGEKITTQTLRKTIKNGTLPSLKNVVNNNTKIIFHASGLIENKALLKTLRDAFSAKNLPKVIASPYHTIFGGKFSNHYLAQPYYLFYPTAKSPGKTDLSKEIAKKYPKEDGIDWFDALHNYNERFVGDTYTTQFSIPVKWEFNFLYSDNAIPVFTSQKEAIDWIKLQDRINTYNIPLEKFRWSWTVKNSSLVIEGRTTGLCVIKPLIKPYGNLKYIEPDTSNKRLYAMK